MLSDKENTFKNNLIEEMKKEGATPNDIALISDELIKNAIKNNRNVKDVAWAIMQ